MIVLLTLGCLPGVSFAIDAEQAIDPKVPAFEAVDMRFLSDEAKGTWLAQQRKTLTIEQRKTGPFGLSQDLTAKKVAKVMKNKPVKSDAFPKAIAKIQIHVVFGSSFLIGAREFKKGETFSLEHNQNTFTIRVSSVNTKQIIFKDVTTGEQVIKQLDAVPEGLERDQGFESVPGVIPDNQKESEPVKIGGGEK